MSEAKPALPLWPFILVDALFLGLAVALVKLGHHPLSWQEGGLVILCGALGSWSFVTPFLRRNTDEQAFSQTELLAEATAKIQKLDELGGHIARATNQWLELQTHTTQAAETSKKIADRMETEAKALTDFMQRSSETERNHLRVETEKLRRSEMERVQVIVHLLDHVFALFLAARQSGQPALVEQIGQFQNACRDVARRIGLLQIMATPGDAYEEKAHQLPSEISARENATVADTLVPGYTYQGNSLRRPVVTLAEGEKNPLLS